MVRVSGWIVAGFVVLSGCTSTKRVEGPDGTSGHLVSCTDTADCYAEARQACDGPYRIIESGNRKGDLFTAGPGGSNSWHEILIQCGDSGGSPAAASSKPSTGQASASAAGATLDAESAPTGAVGFDFGDTVDATSARCTNAGHEWKALGTKYKCTGTAVETGLDAHARLTFCKDTLCRIEVASPPPADTEDLSIRLQKVLKLLTERYGNPTKREVTLPQSCTGRKLAHCLEHQIARFQYQWSFPGRRAVTLSLGAKKVRESYEEPKHTESELTSFKTIRVRYDEGRSPDPAKNASAAEGTPDSEREVGGL